ncbi:hypothetical protein BO78DRAFT_422297 [Aspergillus sclerotiicarbonarius CBS 121057]|uniref:Uncharacterized protein n=1 Tax=Aspergillus sclerotiicarbonarius (strain CBS 121057 / IBT 28362) TaxID=1448318 RepID=A0A319FA00_ASPSB|nr:hypothetical protein BO78DRAFT_422297 [Aspergillus sclerotiicarbonarius CBS 121057]
MNPFTNPFTAAGPNTTAGPSTTEGPFITADGLPYYRQRTIQQKQGTEAQREADAVREENALLRALQHLECEPGELRHSYLLSRGMDVAEYYRMIYTLESKGVELTHDDNMTERRIIVKLPVVLGRGSLDYSWRPFGKRNVEDVCDASDMSRSLPVNTRYLVAAAMVALKKRIETGSWANADSVPGVLMLECHMFPSSADPHREFTLLHHELEYLQALMERNQELWEHHQYVPYFDMVSFPYTRGICKIMRITWEPSDIQLNAIFASNERLKSDLTQNLSGQQ